MSERRVVRLWNEEITSYKMSTLIDSIEKLLEHSTSEPITFEVYSGGGNCEAGFAFCDWVAAHNVPLHTVGYGQVSSMAVPLFLLGTHRVIGARCTMTLHPMVSIFTEKQSLAGDALGQQISSLTHWQDIYLTHLVKAIKGADRKTLKKMMDKDTTIKAKKALSLGFAHEIVG